MSPHAACASQGAALFPDLFPSPSWFEVDHRESHCDHDNPFELPAPEVPFSDTKLARLAQAFLERSEALIDAIPPPRLGGS